MPVDAGRSQKSTPKKKSPSGTKQPSASVPSYELLAEYARVGQDLPALVMKEWGYRHRRQFWYAAVSTTIGGLIALALIGGYIYLVHEGHSGMAGTLLGAGALGMVAGFRATRLDS